MNDNSEAESSYTFFRKVLIFIGVALPTTLLVIFIGKAIDILLLIFSGILLGIIFRSSRDFIHQKIKLAKGVSLAVVVLLFLGIFTGIGFVVGPTLQKQADKFYSQLPETWSKTKKKISEYEWGRELANENPSLKDFFKDKEIGPDGEHDMTDSILSYLSGVASMLAALVLIFVTAIYIAAEPKLYSQGFIRLFPFRRRKQVSEIMDEISITIQWWLLGQVCSMLLLGILTSLGLWLLGVPFAILLGSFTALMTFIPNLGPIIAAVPTLTIALTVGIDTAIYTAIFFGTLQCLEGYFITPMIHRKSISIPPVLIITVQFLLYYLIGFLGVLLAMPLMGVAKVLIKKLYIEDILGDSMDEEINTDLKGKNIF